MKYVFCEGGRKSIRLKGYDYSSQGYYYVTICSRNRECIFSEIDSDVGAGLAPALDNVKPKSHDSKIKLSKIGEIIDYQWNNIINRYNNINIDEYVIMPNHMHGIICIDMGLSRIPARGIPTLNQIREYIKDNPFKWHEDENNPINIK